VARRLLNTHPTDRVEGEGKFRTTPIRSTITTVSQLPKSAILYKCEASKYWQFRAYIEGAQRKRSTKHTDIEQATRAARLIYAEMLLSIHGTEEGKRKLSSKSTLNIVANSLFAKQDIMVQQGELSANRARSDRYVFKKHIQPYFKDYDIKRINSDAVENFKFHLAQKGLAKATQKGYLDLTFKILKEAIKKEYITTLPLMPRVRIQDEPRGYFNPTEYTKLWQTAKRMIGQTYLHRSKKGKVFRKTTITKECFQLILFMRNTYIRPTDVKFIRHKDIFIIERDGFKLLQLRHATTKRHSKYMTSTEHALKHYNEMVKEKKSANTYDKDDYIFLPDYTNREHALKLLANQFMAVLDAAALKKDAHGKPRTLYSLRHTAIMTAITDGLETDVVASNARTSADMIHRFYASHIEDAMEMGNQIVENMKAKQIKYAAKKQNAKKTA
jgi:hypothetical protein